MNRDDRLFAITGAILVTVVTAVFLVFAGGITGAIDSGPELTVRQLPAPAAEAKENRSAPSETVPVNEPTDVVQASNDAPAAGNALVRTMVAGISAHPQWAAWLVSDELLTTFVNAVEAVADGYSPADELGFMTSGGPFLVRENEGRLVIAAGTYRRYNLAVDVLTSLDSDRAVELVRILEPEIEIIRSEMAWHRGNFESRLQQAMDHLIEVTVPSGPIAVERRSATYSFAADEHEMLSGAQRQLLRMGGENARAVQDKLREIRRSFDWPETSPDQDEKLFLAQAPAEPEIVVAAGAPSPEPMMTPFDPRVSGISIPLMTEATVIAGKLFEPEDGMTPIEPAPAPLLQTTQTVSFDATAVP